MSGTVGVDTASLRGSAKGLHSVAESLQAQHDAYAAQMTPLVPKVGMDMFSPLIAGAMTGVLTATGNAVASNVKGLHRHAGGLESMADVHDQTEAATVAAANDVRV